MYLERGVPYSDVPSAIIFDHGYTDNTVINYTFEGILALIDGFRIRKHLITPNPFGGWAAIKGHNIEQGLAPAARLVPFDCRIMQPSSPPEMRSSFEQIKCTFEKGKAYEIKIETAGTAKSAYCKFVINEQEYYTEQISTAAPYNTITFTLTFDAPTEIESITRWGMYHIPNDEKNFYNGKSCTILKEKAG